MWPERIILKDHPHSSLFHWHFTLFIIEGAFSHRNPTTSRCYKACYHTQNSGLTAPGRPQERKDLPFFYSQINIRDHLSGSVTLAQVVDFEKHTPIFPLYSIVIPGAQARERSE